MKLLGLFKKGGTVDKITALADKAIVDKDKRNEFVFQIASMMMQSKIAPFIRAIIAIISVIAIMFFSDKITLPPEEQKYVLYAVYGFYFLDRIFSSKLGK